MSKKKRIILIISLSLVIVSIVSFFMFTRLGKMYRDITILMSTGKKINMEGNFQELKGIEGELKNYDVYLTGEAHGTELSYKMQQYMARYFIEEQGVRYILLEAPVSMAEILNEYLKTGDTDIIKRLVNKFEGSYAYNQDTYDLYEFYYDYNKQLPEDKKIMFVGIDVEHNNMLSAEYLTYLTNELGEPPTKIADIVKRLKKYDWGSDYFLFNDIRKSLKDDENVYKEYLGEDFFYFNKVVKNVFTENQTVREATIVQNFKDFYEKLPKGKYYGQFGGAHVYKKIRTEYTCGEDPINTFANSVNNDYGPLKGRVYSMIYMYMNSYNSLSGEEYNISEINIPYIDGSGSVRLYTPISDKKVLKILKYYGLKQEDVGDAFFLIKDSKASPKFYGE
ncbi:erythromycin esterase family protein [Clostridium sulfidigenes]|uniref:erythromycin esterase family protein n=1 Tax=Clostridium sulfidigenes TaxID=318464 RepID=UPI003F891411